MIRRFPATFSTRASPWATCVTGTVFSSATATALPPASRASLEELRFDDVRQVTLFQDDLLRIHARKGRIVLMDTMNRHPVNRRSGRFRQCLSPLDVGRVGQTRPVHNAHHDRFSGTKQHVTDRFLRIIHADHRFDPAATERMTHGRRHIVTESGESQSTHILSGQLHR